MRRLLEHQKFKAAAELLHERETLRSAQWTRADGPIAEIAGEAPEPEIEVDLFSLISAFRNVVERAKQRPKIYLPGEQMPIEDRIEQLLSKLSETEACGFEDLFADMQTRSGMIVTFLAHARDDSAEADSRVPVRRDGRDPRVQARAAGRRAQAAARSGEPLTHCRNCQHDCQTLPRLKKAEHYRMLDQRCRISNFGNFGNLGNIGNG